MYIRLMATILLLMPSLAQAAYQNPTVIANERQPNGATKLIFRFNGDADEPAVTREFTVNATTTAALLRNWADSTINELNLMHAAASLPALQPGQTVPRLAPSAPVPSAKMVWRAKVYWYMHLKDAGLLGPIVTDLLALKADIEATYQAGYLLGD